MSVRRGVRSDTSLSVLVAGFLVLRCDPCEVAVACASGDGLGPGETHTPKSRQLAVEITPRLDVSRDSKFSPISSQTCALRSRSALKMTDTELKLIAAAASIGLRSRPEMGYKTPAATGTPSAL